MGSQLPPLAAIRAFEAAARHASFTKAADELGMTQAAVSYQIKVLEERIGTPLFLRKPRQVVLTETGQRLAPAITEAFAHHQRGLCNGARRRGRARCASARCRPSPPTGWPAISVRSRLAHPSLAVRLDTASHLVDFAREDVDVGIRSGGGKWPGLATHFLFRADFTPMLSPKLAESIGGVKQPGRSFAPADPRSEGCLVERNGSTWPACRRTNWRGGRASAWARRPH